MLLSGTKNHKNHQKCKIINFSQFEPDDDFNIEADDVMAVLSRMRIPEAELQMFRRDCQDSNKKINRNAFVEKIVKITK